MSSRRAKRPPAPAGHQDSGLRDSDLREDRQSTAAARQLSAQPCAVSRDALAESLRMTRESMSVLQKMQEETAQLHRRFLEGQETAGRTFQTLLENSSAFSREARRCLPAIAAPVSRCQQLLQLRRHAMPVSTRALSQPQSSGCRRPSPVPTASHQSPDHRR